MFLPHFDVFCDLLLNQTHGNMESICNNEKPLLFQNISTYRESRPFAPPLHEKKPLDVIYLFKMKRFHWLLCVAKNCDWSRKIAPLSNLTRAPLLVEWKLTAKAELSCEIYKSWRKCWKNQVSFCHRSSPVSRKAWTLPWKLQEFKKIPSKNLWLWSTRFEFWMKGA